MSQDNLPYRTKKYTGPPCTIEGVSFFQTLRPGKGCNTSLQEKSAEVTLNWWDTVKDKFIHCSIFVSRARGVQFKDQLHRQQLEDAGL